VVTDDRSDNAQVLNAIVLPKQQLELQSQSSSEAK